MSHKLLRLAVPWALVAVFVSSGVLSAAALSGLFCLRNASAYGCALLALSSRAFCRIPLMSAAAGFLVLNSACGLAFLVWLTGGAGRIWGPVCYELTDGCSPR